MAELAAAPFPVSQLPATAGICSRQDGKEMLTSASVPFFFNVKLLYKSINVQPWSCLTRPHAWCQKNPNNISVSFYVWAKMPGPGCRSVCPDCLGNEPSCFIHSRAITSFTSYHISFFKEGFSNCDPVRRLKLGTSSARNFAISVITSSGCSMTLK